MARSKLKSALDNEKGRNIKLEKQRKQEKEARKRKEQQKPAEDDDSEAEGGVALKQEVKAAAKSNGKAKKGKADGAKAAAPAAEAEWETDDSEDEDASDDDEEEVPFDLSRLDDSESDVSGDDEEDEEVGEALGAGGDDDEDEDAEDDEDDIALSDIESLADEDKADIIPHQRLTINNTAALTAGLNRIKLPYSKLAFSEYMSLTTDEDVEIEDVDDDLNRELAFYKQALSAAKDARSLLKKEGAPFSRPADYFAEMVKSDEHMGKIKQKLMDEAAGKKASAEARKQRDLKKFGKQVQVAKLQERAKEKRDTLDKITQLKRKRSGADIGNTNEEDLFDVELDKSDKPDRRGGEGGGNFKRQKKNEKFGFGGKKRHAKSNDAVSSADGRGFSHKKMKGKAGGAAKRPGKSRRMKSK